jgi:hypothetical protein
VPNQILVKFRLTTSANQRQAETTINQSLERLNQQFRIRKTQQVFGEFARQQRKMEGLRNKAPGQLTKQEKRLLQRSQRASGKTAVPALDRIYLVELKDGQDVQAALKAFQADKAVEYAEPDFIVHTYRTPSDSYYPVQWALENTGQMYPESGNYNDPPGSIDADIDAETAWDIFTGGSDIVVAVIDTGVDYTHRDIDANRWINETEMNGTAGVDDDLNGYVDDIYGYDFSNDDSDPMDDSGHGTHCAGVIAAEGDNGQDIAGICWQSKIMALKFLDTWGYGKTSNAVKAFYYAVTNGADVISNSWGGGGDSQILEDVICYAADQGVILVAAAGNDYSNTPSYPAYYDAMIAVAATDSLDQKPSFSNYGDWVDIAAPGVDILSLKSSQARSYVGKTYETYMLILSGTSMACPQVAGACALLLGANPTLTRDEVTQILLTTGDSIAPGICSSNRRLNVGSMLREVISAQGRICLTRDEYSCSDEIKVLLADGDLAEQGSYSVSLTAGNDTESLNLMERSAGIGVYNGTMASASGNAIVNNGILELQNGQTIQVLYNDANDGAGNNVICEDTALADCIGPVISDVTAAQVGAFWAKITLQTDEPSRVTLRYGNNCHHLNLGVVEDLALATSHTLFLYDLNSETTYRYNIIATDEYGYEMTAGGGNDCFGFTTLTEVPGRHVPIEYPTIQDAIDAAVNGDTVWVADGIYQGSGNRDLDFKCKAITVQSEFGPDGCIIDSQGNSDTPHCAFYIHVEEGADSVVDGFTITGGYSPYVETIGGGIVCENSNPTIRNCIISNNTAVFGGGMRNNNSSPTVTHCQFIGNAAHESGGAMDNYNNSHPVVTDCNFINNCNDTFYSDEWGGGAVGMYENSNPVFNNCRFEGSTTWGMGGAMYIEGACNPVVKNCIFINNSTLLSGGAIGIDWGNSNPYIINCRFINNAAERGGGLFFGGSSLLMLVNCVFDGNRATRNGGGAGITGGTPRIVNNTFYGNQSENLGGGIFIENTTDAILANSIFWRNRDINGYLLNSQIYGWTSVWLNYNCIETWDTPGYDCNRGDDPLFLNPEGEDGIAGTEDDNLRPGPGSPYVDAGSSNWIPQDEADIDDDGDIIEWMPFDLDCKNRIVDDPCTIDSGLPRSDPCLPPISPWVVDIGAYEGPYQGFYVEPSRITINEGQTATFSVSLWQNPQRSIVVTVGYYSGDTDISVIGGTELLFDSSNYYQPQTVMLEAAQDIDFLNGSTTILLQAQAFVSRKIPVTESDDDPVPIVVYVDAAATGNGNGVSWEDAFTDLQSILKFADQRPGIQEIHVAQGIYYPDGGICDRNASFVLIDGMALRGGYAGVENADPNTRNIELYPTLLSGDLNEDDEVEFENVQDNSYHVVTGKNLSSNTVLDGFIIEASNAEGGDVHQNGGGMINLDGSPQIMDCQFRLNLADGNGSGMYNENSSPHVVRCQFSGNSMGGNSGAGMYNQDSSPVIEDCDFIGNYAGVGGGMANYGSGSAMLIRCLFRDNHASFGGGLYTTDNCNPMVIDCIFDNNHAGYTGGGLELRGGNPTIIRCRIINNTGGQYDWGGGGIDMYQGTAIIDSCTIAGNSSGENGGGMFVWNGFANMFNCTIVDNSAVGLGGGIYLFTHLTGSATLKNCILWNPGQMEVEGKTITINYSDVRDDYTGTGNKNEEPLFVNAAGGDYHIRWDSPCIDSGDPLYSPQASWQDIDGEPRTMRANCVDMGSDEVGLKQADFTRNGIVNMADLSIFLNSWLANEVDANWAILCDLFADQRIDLQDFSQFTQDWLWQADWYEE